jgi:hypothetical protein
VLTGSCSLKDRHHDICERRPETLLVRTRSLVSKLTTFVDDAVLLLLLTMAIPFALLIVGAPLALIIRVVVEIFGRIF